MARRLPAFAALVTAFVATVSAGTSAEAPGEFAPLSTLGHLRPAPYPGDPGPELVPIPAARVLAPPASTARAGKPVDGIRCEFNARVVFHVHIHLTLFVDGKQRALPAGIGIWPPLGPQNYRNGQFGITRGNCFSWLSTHYLWGQPLSRSRVGPARGQVTVIVGRRVWTGDPRRVPLAAHAQIQLEVGSPLVAPETIEFPGGF
jgi:hypothetical protein